MGLTIVIGQHSSMLPATVTASGPRATVLRYAGHFEPGHFELEGAGSGRAGLAGLHASGSGLAAPATVARPARTLGRRRHSSAAGVPRFGPGTCKPTRFPHPRPGPGAAGGCGRGRDASASGRRDASASGRRARSPSRPAGALRAPPALAATPVWRKLTSGLNLGRRLQLFRMPRQCAHQPSVIRTPSLAVPDHTTSPSLLGNQ